LLDEIPAYYFPVRASDGIFLGAFDYPAEFLGDTLPPQIFNVGIDRITGLAEWQTDEFATSEVWYGSEFGSYTHVVSSTLWAKDHLFMLSGLTGDMQFFLIRGADRSGNVAEYYIPGYSISGNVKDQNNAPIPDVVISVSPTQVAVTDDSGDYALQGVQPGEHVITPFHDDYTFTPDSIPVALSENLTGKDFVGKRYSAAFSAAPTSGPAPLEVVFTNTSTGDYDTCSWLFGDGGTSSNCNNPNHTYAAPGIYNVTLTVSGLGGTDTLLRAAFISVYDSEPPTGSILINTKDTYTDNPAVNLALSATDNVGVTEMRLSYNGSWHDWEAYASSKGVTLTGGDGTQLVSVQYRDAAGNTSNTYADTIILDTTPPSGSISIDSGATYASSTPVTLSLSATDSGSGVAAMRFSNGGSGWSSWESYTASRSWTLASGDGAKTVYVQYRDAAGNTSPTYNDSIILDTVPPSSAVEPLPPYPDTTIVAVSWSGSDDTSAVACYDVQHRHGPDGAWDGWQTCTTDVKATFTTGTPEHTYYFRSRAQDNAGNWEDYPTNPDYDTFAALPPEPWLPGGSYKVFLPISP
jgi:PKD repeat protein